VPPKRTFIKPGQKLELDLTPAERRAILDHLTLLPPEYEVMLKKVHPEQPLLLTLDDLEDFSGYVAAESNHTKNKKLRAVLDSAFEKMGDLLDKFTDEEPPQNKQTKNTLAAERAESEQQATISDQATFIATWAAGVLHAADQKRAKDDVLESFIPGELEQVVLTTIEDVSPAVRRRLATGKKDFTLGEVGGMLMAVASELCVASVQQRIAMLMVAKSLMDAMQDWLGEMQADNQDQNGRPCSRPERKAVKKKPGRKKKPGS
jgi:hypothetical protein